MIREANIVTCCPETDSVCLTEKFMINHQISFLIWIFLTVCSMQLPFRHLFRVFYLSCRSTSNFFLSVVLFFSASVPVYFFAVLQTWSLLFLWKKFRAGKRNSSPSWKSLFAVEENYFNRALTSLISLQWVMYEGSFQVCDGRWWKKILECQSLKLGDAHVHPQ